MSEFRFVSFPFNILMQIDRISPNFIYAFIWTLSWLGLLPVIFRKFIISILPKNHAGPVEKLISDFFRMPKKVDAIDSL